MHSKRRALITQRHSVSPHNIINPQQQPAKTKNVFTAMGHLQDKNYLKNIHKASYTTVLQLLTYQLLQLIKINVATFLVLAKMSIKISYKTLGFSMRPNVAGWTKHGVPECVLCLVFGRLSKLLSLSLWRRLQDVNFRLVSAFVRLVRLTGREYVSTSQTNNMSQQ
jgi:hypothetical protein